MASAARWTFVRASFALRQNDAYSSSVPPVAVMRVMQAVLVSAAAAVPTVEIAPGVHMPMISLGAGHTSPLPTPRHTAQHPQGVPLR